MQDCSFDLGAFLSKTQPAYNGVEKKKNTGRFDVAKGVEKRLEINVRNRKSTRSTVFDRVRDLPKCEPPAPQKTQLTKQEERKLQLERYKKEKELKKKEEAKQKKKPFLTGIPTKPIGPPPNQPSTLGRVTRSQTACQSTAKAKTSRPNKSDSKHEKSFAPKHAPFKAPTIKNLVKLPVLEPPNNKRKKKCNITFDPIMPSTSKATSNIQTRSRTALTRQNAIDMKPLETSSDSDDKRIKIPSGRKSINAHKDSSQSQTSTSQSLSSGSSTEISSDVRQSPVMQKGRKSLVNIRRVGNKKSESSSKEKKAPERTNMVSNRRVLNQISESNTEEKKAQQGTNTVKTRRISNRKSIRSEKKNTSVETNMVNNHKVGDQISESSSDEKKSALQETNVVKTRRLSKKKSISSSEKKTNAQEETKTINTPRIRIRKSSTSSKENSNSLNKLRTTKSPQAYGFVLSPEQQIEAMNSPCVTLSRGKLNATKEMKWKLNEGLLDEDASNDKIVDHFRQQLSSEINRLTAMCDMWEKISNETVLPESVKVQVQEHVLVATGQARLLMSSKMQQFASLVSRCASALGGSATPGTLVTPADLQGFWDMLFLQVENVDMRFKKLENLRNNNWVEQASTVVPSKPRVVPRVARPPPKVANSRIKDMIAAARKAKKQQEPEEESKVFEGHFFTVRSPIKCALSPAHCTPVKSHSLLQHVLSNEAKKSASKNSPFAMMRASLIAKNMDFEEGIAPLPDTPPPVRAPRVTPRSILKSAPQSARAHRRTPAQTPNSKVVLFQ